MITNLQIFERKARQPKIGSYIFDLFFTGEPNIHYKSDFGAGGNFYTEIEITSFSYLKGKLYYDKKLLENLINIINQIESYFTDNNENVKYMMHENYLSVYIYIRNQNIIKLESTKEYKKWEEKEAENFEITKLKKTAKKYNI